MNEYNSNLIQTQEQFEKVKNTEKENERKKASPYYKNRTTVAMKKSTRALLNDLADEKRVNSYEMSDIIVQAYAKEHYPERYEKFLNGELKGQEKIY
ncbi:MAG: hypothetical protein E7J02_08730 [Staphylococcus warneri]|nr:hypothetical protein [Staphylococcus warneri]MDU4503075.1 hypothetical protein [Staphylococcus warneri]